MRAVLRVLAPTWCWQRPLSVLLGLRVPHRTSDLCHSGFLEEKHGGFSTLQAEEVFHSSGRESPHAAIRVSEPCVGVDPWVCLNTPVIFCLKSILKTVFCVPLLNISERRLA